MTYDIKKYDIMTYDFMKYDAMMYDIMTNKVHKTCLGVEADIF